MADEFKKFSNGSEAIDRNTLLQAGFKNPNQRATLDTVYRAVDSTNKEAVLGPGVYFGLNKSSVERYGKNIQQFSIDPRAKMLDLDNMDKLDKFTGDAMRQYPDRFVALTQKYGDQGVGYLRAEVAQKMGYDGITGDDEVFGSVLFNKKYLISK